MATAKERRDIMYNVIARVGLDGPVLSEYAKAINTLNGLQTYSEINPPPIPQNIPPEQSLGAVSEPAAPEMGGNAAMTGTMP